MPQLKIIEEALPEIEIHCDVSVYVAKSGERAYELYEANRHKHSAFVFSGRAFMFSAAKRAGALKKPCYYFDDVTGNINDIILELVLKDRSFDFSRTFVDIACKGNNYLGLRELLPPEQWPYFADESEAPFSIDSFSDAEEVTQRTLERHLKLNRENRIDLSITRFGSIVGQLGKIGKTPVYMQITKEYVINFFMQIINVLNQTWSRDQMMGCAILRFESEKEERSRHITAASKAIMEYAGRKSLDFSLLRESDAIYILTRRVDLEKLTKKFTDSGDMLALAPSRHVRWGLGTGVSMFQAKRNAANAANLAKRTGGIYYISEEGEVTGPIGNNSTIYDMEPTEELLLLSAAFHMDHVNLQKILAYTKLSNSNAVTAEDLAIFLGVTTRSAGRLLQKILSGGGAGTYEEASGSRGRPKKYYKLLFADQME